MGRKNVDAFWDRVNLLNINNNFIELYKDFDFTFELKRLVKKLLNTQKKLIWKTKKYKNN